jgi:LPXTG-site transpeptidase (sortase) family protein
MLSNLLILTGSSLLVLTYGPLIRDEVWYQLKEIKAQRYTLNDPDGNTDSAFARFLTFQPITLNPVNSDFSLVIEKIGVNVPVKADVSVIDEKAYIESLKEGVAHAALSSYPSDEPGNVYIFAHASVNFWQLGRYATVFNLLRKLDPGDVIHVFYKNHQYTYRVVGKEVLQGWETTPISRTVIEPILTLQTCDPPGTTINRLVVTARLVDSKPY